MKEESEKVGLKLHIQKTNIMASDPITSWEIDGEPEKRKRGVKENHIEKQRHYFANKSPS